MGTDRNRSNRRCRNKGTLYAEIVICQLHKKAYKRFLRKQVRDSKI